jgi:hypothetical protein
VVCGNVIEGPSCYCHGAIILVKECILEGGLHDPFGIYGACPPFHENYLSDIGVVPIGITPGLVSPACLVERLLSMESGSYHLVGRGRYLRITLY